MNANKLVIFSGYWNIGLAAYLLLLPLLKTPGLNLQPLWAWLIAGFLLYISATLIISGRDLNRYGTIVVYDALLRFAAAFLLIPAGLFFDFGLMVVLLGATDAIWGYILISKVPATSGRSLKQLLLGQG